MNNQFLLDTFLHLNEDDEMMIMCILLFVGIVVCCTILAQRVAVNSMNKNDLAENDINHCPKVSVKARIINKIEAENYKDTYFGYPHIVFETANMERIKFAISDKNLYEHLIIGDEGLLEYAGRAFISFKRETIQSNDPGVISTFKTGDSL